MFFLLLPVLCYSVTSDQKENSCLLISNNALKFRSEDYKAFTSQNPELNKRKIYMRLVEDTFYHCLKTITEEEVKKIGHNRPPDLSLYKHLFSIPFEEYTVNTNLENSEKFVETRRKINNRLAKLQEKPQKDL